MKTIFISRLQLAAKQLGVALLVLVVAVVAGCGGKNSQLNTPITEGGANESWSIKHELGTVKLEQVPQKIVVLDTYLLDIALALGLRPIGAPTESPGKEELPSYLKSYVDYDLTWVGARNDPNLEVLAGLEPDLIVADLQRHQKSYEALEKIAPTMVVSGSGAEDWKTIITQLGEATRQQEKAKTVIADFEQKLEAGKAELAGSGFRAVAPITLYPKSVIRIYTAQSYTGAILQGLGLELPYEAGGKPFEELSVEAIGDVKADAFILMQSPEHTADVIPEEYPIFGNLDVVKSGHAYTVSMEQWLFYRGPLAGEVIIREAIDLFAKS